MDKKIPTEKLTHKPDFAKIFKEMAQKNEISVLKYQRILEQKNWDSLDVIEANDLLFTSQTKENIKFNKRHKAYDENSIKRLLEYQRQNELNNSEMTRLFGISRNTLARWHKIFAEKSI